MSTPFDLVAARDTGDPVELRDGTAATFVAHVPTADERDRVVVLVDGTISTRHEDGLMYLGLPSIDDLVMTGVA